MPSKLLTRVALALAAAMPLAAQADVTTSGQFTHHNQRQELVFVVDAAATSVHLWTDSWQQGLNFDPMLTVFTLGGSWLASNDDDDNADLSRAYDAGLTLSGLSAGASYRVVLSAAPNAAIGSQLADGFSLDAETPVALVDWVQPSSNINAGDQKGGFWQLHLDGVAQAMPVPEPTTLALWLSGLLALALMARRRGGQGR